MKRILNERNQCFINVNAKVLKNVVDFAYYGKSILSQYSMDELIGLEAFAKKFKANRLATLCAGKIIQHINIRNCCSLMKQPTLLKHDGIQQKCVDTIKQSLTDISQDGLVSISTAAFLEILNDSDVDWCTEMNKLEIAMKWCCQLPGLSLDTLSEMPEFQVATAAVISVMSSIRWEKIQEEVKINRFFDLTATKLSTIRILFCVL